jgi:MinD superfamily P-loop ATPase
MGPGEENSGKLVTQVRRKAKELAREEGLECILTDGPPGTGCPAIASITGTSQVLLVMEPSKSSLHDAQRVIELVRQFDIPLFALINKWDIHPEFTQRIESYLTEENIPLLGKLPFDETMVEAMIQGLTICEYKPGSAQAHLIQSVWEALEAPN